MFFYDGDRTIITYNLNDDLIGVDNLEIQLLIKLDDEHAISKMMDIEDNVAKVVLEQEDTLGIEGVFRYEIRLNNHSPRVLEQKNIKIRKSLITGFDYLPIDYEMVNVKDLESRVTQLENNGGGSSNGGNNTGGNYDDTQIKADIQANTDDISSLDNRVSANTNALNDKVDKQTGKGLSTNDFNDTYKSKIDTHGVQIADLDTNKAEKNSVYSRSQLYIKTEIDTLLDAITGIEVVIVDTLPEQGENGYIYLTPKDDGSGDDVHLEYIWAGDKFELIGSTSVDLSDYFTKSQVTSKLADKADKTELDGYVQKVSGKVLSSNDYLDDDKVVVDKVKITPTDPTNKVLNGEKNWVETMKLIKVADKDTALAQSAGDTTNLYYWTE